jgi:TonB family protein
MFRPILSNAGFTLTGHFCGSVSAAANWTMAYCLRGLNVILSRCLFLTMAAAALLPAWQKNATQVVLSQQPVPAPDLIVRLEHEVAQAPDDIPLRTRMLQVYAAAAPLNRDDYRAARLRHIQFVIQANPAGELASSGIAWVGSRGTLYPNADDHAGIRTLWLSVLSQHFNDTPVVMNALRFLAIEDKQQAEDLFQRQLAERPAEVQIASNLGFFYAAGLVGSDTLDGRVLSTLPDPDRNQWSSHCRERLQNNLNPHVLMGAATALPNMAMRRTGGGPTFEDLVKYSEELRRRAGTLDSDGNAKGMPVEFQMFADESKRGMDQPGPQTLGVPFTPNQVRVGGNVQSAKVLLAPPPNYPAAAMRGKIQGTVRMQVVIAQDGTVSNVQLVSGHPLLAQAALDAVKSWTYRPTLLNGSPVSVVTTVDVPFTLPPE